MHAIPSLNKSTFLQAVFETLAREKVYSDFLEELICDEHVEICRDFDLTHIQESWSWRNTHFARELAKQLIDDNGMDRSLLLRAIQLLEKSLYSMGPNRFHDAPRQEHILKILRYFYDNKEPIIALKKIHSPQEHAIASHLIRDTLLLSRSERITDTHAKQAVFSALLTSLRQNVGSCFATAPAILIQQNQELQFISDMERLLGSGRLTRVIDGVEYAVPLSPSWGVGDLLRPFYLSTLGRHPAKILSFSPGLQTALVGAGLIDAKASRHERQKKCESLLKRLSSFSDSDPFAIYSADQILQALLFEHFSVTKNEIQTYLEKPIQEFREWIPLSKPSSLGEKDAACSRYLKAYEQAKTAFITLTDNALLKAWEFTLASLSESKADFAKWNLYASLGVRPEEPGGIGESLYIKIQEKIQQLNQEIAEFQSNYDHLFAQAKYLEGRMRRASTESEVGWVRAEYEMRRHEIERALSARDATYEKGRKLQSLYPSLIEFYGNKIRDYFQEVYDAQMLDVAANPYDDSPAGFRLLYKHGRSNTSVWTMIHSSSEYIQHLASFFVSTEAEIHQLHEFDGLEKEVSELVTTAITTIKRPDFLESSIHRLAEVYHEPIVKNPLENLDKIKRKPWSYISGGTMATLVSCYWGGGELPLEEKRWVENPTELLAFFIDSMKERPLSVQEMYRKKTDLSMLSFSPTHAFLCKPGWKLFREGWESETYTYTWIRDVWVNPQHRFLDESILTSRMLDTISSRLLHFIPNSYCSIVKNALKEFHFSMSAPEFREHVQKTLSYDKWLRQGRKLEVILEELDSILYRLLPLFPDNQLRERLRTLFEAINEIDFSLQNEIFRLFDLAEESVGRYNVLTAEDLRHIAKGLLMLAKNETRGDMFYHQMIVEAMQKTGLCYPAPILFADTNWVNNVFGFTLNPGTREVELWRFDACATEGRSISVWRQYVDGTVKEEWGLYTQPNQYGQF